MSAHMRLAVIGWGSLIWCPGELAIATRWHLNGPFLPLEFARISKDGRPTLVIHPHAAQVRTYWAISRFDDLGDAIENLRKREGTNTKCIAYQAQSSASSIISDFHNSIQNG
jgi:hypothetical protein